MEIKDITLGLCLTIARIVMIKKTQPAWHSNTTGEEKHNTLVVIHVLQLDLSSTQQEGDHAFLYWKPS